LSLAGGTASTFFTQTREGQPRSRMLSEANINRLVDKLSRMRGAALKLGQFMSIQGPFLDLSYRNQTQTGTDTHALPPELDQVFRRVQNSANYMPNWQMEVGSLLCYSVLPLRPSSESHEGSLGTGLPLQFPFVQSHSLCCGIHRTSSRSAA
jgi:hypothetical protein